VRGRDHHDLGRRTVSGLAHHLEGWWPAPLRRSDRIHPWPVDAFAGLLDQPSPLAGGNSALPPMWHLFSFLEYPAQHELGADGHPAAGHFLPPIPHRRRMFAGGRWHYHRPLRVGDEVTLRSTVISIEPKIGRSGDLVFVTVRHEYSIGDLLAGVEEQDIVYRSEPPAAPAAPSAPPTEPAEDTTPAEHELRIDPDPTLLFRFSALTYNAHRIHYDQPYATGVEGYPRLVVHGPLLALLALELPRRHHPEAQVLEFHYRLRRPAFTGATIQARGWAPAGDGWCGLAVGELGRLPSLTATVRLRAVEEE